MSGLSFLEKIELGAMPVLVAIGGWLTPGEGFTWEIGQVVAAAALLLLVQGFFRDLYLLWESKRTKPLTPPASARCMCVESAVGLTGVTGGIALTAVGLDHPLHFEATHSMASIGSVMIIGFLLKDFVFEWAPWRIFREKNHAQVIFRWKKQ